MSTTPETTASPVVTARTVLVLLLAGFVLMGAGSLYYLKNSPGLIKQSNRAAAATPAQQESQQQVDRMIVALMNRLAEDENDPEALGLLGGLFLDRGEWAPAERFLARAVVASPSDPMPVYLLGIAQAQQDKALDAEANFLRSIELGGPVEVRYSLGLLYAHLLDRPDEGKALFAEVIASPDASPDLRDLARNEEREH